MRTVRAGLSADGVAAVSAVSLVVNGRTVRAEIEPRTSLGELLRGGQFLTGTHLACEHGVCGACTVLVNGLPARSCIAFAVALEGAEVRTVEGFDADPVMQALRAAFRAEHALQCGYCTPGMLVTARDIVTRLARPDEARIRAELAGNLCRCTGYVGIVNAIQRVLDEIPAAERLVRPLPAEAKPGDAGAPAPFRTFVPVRRSVAPGPAPSAAAGGPGSDVRSTLPADDRSGEVLPAGWTRLVDRFQVARPRAEVWRAFADIEALGRCLPGMELTARGEHDLEAALSVAFGPIRTRFAGSARVTRDESRQAGRLEGEGIDPRSGTRARGRVAYRLGDAEGGAATRVDITLDYQLSGPLAQFGRMGLVGDLTRRLIAEFARNLSAQLAGPSATSGEDRSDPPPAEGPPRTARAPEAAGAAGRAPTSLNAGTLLLALLRERFRRWLGIGRGKE